MTDFFDLPPDRPFPHRRQVAARRQLEELTAKRSWRLLGRGRQTGLVIGLGVGLSVGGGVALANGLFSPLPGAPRDTTLSRTVTVTRTGTSTVELGPAPRKANAISLTLTGLSVGAFRYADGNGSESLGCDARDIRHPGRYGCTSSGVVPLQAGQRSLTITTSPSARWTLHAMYINQVITAWKTNAHGETYGVPTKEGFPDLIAVDVQKDGHQGYEKSSDLNCAQENAQGRNVSIPVYESNGTTKIGIFIVGDRTPGTPTVPLSSFTCTGPNPYQSHD
jgi:hypothetical protein